MNNDSNTPTKRILPEKVIDEILNKDRLLYLELIKKNNSLSSLQVTQEILALRSKMEPGSVENKKILRENPNVNARLRDLVELGVLNEHGGEYSLSSIGSLVVEKLPALMSNIEVLTTYKQFFDTHDWTVIPPQQFHDIYKLQFAKQCKDAVDYNSIILNQTEKTEHKIHIATDRLHSIPSWIMHEIGQGNVTFELIYQFKELFKLNFNDEEERNLWKNITEMDSFLSNCRYLPLEDRNPVGVRIIDDTWALFNLFEINGKTLDRPKSFYGTDERFVGWIKDMFRGIWEKSKSFENAQINLKG